MRGVIREGEYSVAIRDKAGVRRSGCLVRVVVKRTRVGLGRATDYRPPLFFLRCSGERVPRRGLCGFEELRRRASKEGLVMAICGNCGFFKSFGMIENISRGQAGFCVRTKSGSGSERRDLRLIEESCAGYVVVKEGGGWVGSLGVGSG